MKSVNEDDAGSSPFADASISRAEVQAGSSEARGPQQLSFSRAYTLSLSPWLVYSQSKLLPTLVSSKVYRQLEFQAVGSWWMPGQPTSGGGKLELEAVEEASEVPNKRRKTSLRRVPNGREDVFADSSIDVKSKRALIKFLRYVVDYDEESERAQQDAEKAMPELLGSDYKLPVHLQSTLTALSLSPDAPQETKAKFALPRIKRHLRSIGIFGAGFGSVIPKWGGGAEISQVACRALAVGGGVYVLGRGIKEVKPSSSTEDQRSEVLLSDDETIKAKWIVGSEQDIPLPDTTSTTESAARAARSITIVSSPLEKLFPPISDNGPPSAGSVIIYPPEALQTGPETADIPPVYLLIQNSDTGECPDGQCKSSTSRSVKSSDGEKQQFTPSFLQRNDPT